MNTGFDLSAFWAQHWRPVLAWTAGIALATSLCFFGYMKAVEAGWLKYNKWDRRAKGALRVGQPAPDLELPLVDQGLVRLSELWRARPVFLVFGSCT